MMTLRWLPYPESNVASYRVYRSMVGFSFPNVSLAGLTLQLKLNGGNTQTFTFTADPPHETINATITGGKAYLSQDSSKILVRSNIREAPGSVEIVGGTALVTMEQTPRVIAEKTEDVLLSTVPALVDPDEVVEFEDPDGVLQDFYAISTLDDLGNESSKTAYKQPIASTGPVCVLEGIISSIQGVRIPDAEVKATLLVAPHVSQDSHIDKESVSVFSTPDGRFSIPLLQGSLVLLEIPSVKLSQEITVPEESYFFVKDLQTDLQYLYPPGYRGAR